MCAHREHMAGKQTSHCFNVSSLVDALTNSLSKRALPHSQMTTSTSPKETVKDINHVIIHRHEECWALQDFWTSLKGLPYCRLAISAYPRQLLPSLCPTTAQKTSDHIDGPTQTGLRSRPARPGWPQSLPCAPNPSPVFSFFFCF